MGPEAVQKFGVRGFSTVHEAWVLVGRRLRLDVSEWVPVGPCERLLIEHPERQDGGTSIPERVAPYGSAVRWFPFGTSED